VLFHRLCCTDGSEFLFAAASEAEMEDWVNKVSFHAKLPPSLQLLSYDETHKVSCQPHHQCRYIVKCVAVTFITGENLYLSALNSCTTSLLLVV
jgi:hypothetical protein